MEREGREERERETEPQLSRNLRAYRAAGTRWTGAEEGAEAAALASGDGTVRFRRLTSLSIPSYVIFVEQSPALQGIPGPLRLPCPSAVWEVNAQQVDDSVPKQGV